MSLDEGLSRLIRNIYRAGDDGAAWDAIGHEVLRQTGACAGLRTAVDLTNGEFADFQFFGPETSGVDRALAEYPEMSARDPSLLWAIRNPHAGFCASDTTVPSDDYLGNEWVRWNVARLGATHWYVCYSAPGQGFSHSLSIHIPASQGTARKSQIAKLKMLFEHMDCATWLQRQPREEEAEGVWLLLDRAGKVSLKSMGAEALLASEDGLKLHQSRLTACNPETQRALERCLTLVANGPDSGAGPAALWIDRPSAGHAWLVTVRPLTLGFAGLAKTSAGFHVQVLEPRPAMGPASSLTHLFDLSRREAEVLDLLARGHSIESLALSLCISVGTARIHLRSIFVKTRTSRQSELLQLCAQLGTQ